MRKFLFLIFLLFTSTILQAKDKYYIAAGPTISYFITDNSNISYFINQGYSRSDKGMILRIVREIRSDSFSELYIGIGFSTRAATLNNLLIEPDISKTRHMYFWDIHSRIAYLEIPFLIKLKLPFIKKVNFGPIFGFSLKWPVKDLTKLSKRRYVGEFTEDMEKYPCFYSSFAKESEFAKNPTKFIDYFGFQLKYSRYIFELSWAIDNQENYLFNHLTSIKHKIGSFNTLIYIEF